MGNTSETLKRIELSKIRPCKLNPRMEMSIERLNELAESIREVGLLEPIIVRPIGDDYEVVVGERRYRASHQAGIERIPAIVREYSDDEVVQLNLIENAQREELSAVEKGKVCKYLLENYSDKYPSRNVIAKKIGVSPDAVALWLRALEIIPQEVQTLVAPSSSSGSVPEGKIDYQTAVRAGRTILEPERQAEVIKQLAEKRLPKKERTQVIERAALQPGKPVEDVIAEVVAEVTEAPYELAFTADDKEPILEGKKTQTSRIAIPDPRVRNGAKVQATVQEPRFADLLISSVERKRLRYFNEEDAHREGCRSLKEFIQRWRGAFGEWDETQLVYVIHFEKLS